MNNFNSQKNLLYGYVTLLFQNNDECCFKVGCSDFSGKTEKARSLVHVYDTQR